MNFIDNYIKEVEEVMYEYLNYYNVKPQNLNINRIKNLNYNIDELQEGFESEYKRRLIDYSNNEKKIRALLLDFYVNGICRISCVLNNIKENNIEKGKRINDADKAFINFRKFVGSISTNIREFMFSNIEISMSKIECKKYNISGMYFGDFEIVQRQKSNSIKRQITLVMVALIYSYKGITINRFNAPKIASENGFNSKTSGEKLYQHYLKYFKSVDRKGDSGSKRKMRNKINMIKSILEFLNRKEKEIVFKEVIHIENIVENTY